MIIEVLGTIVTICCVIAPIVFPNPIQFAKSYYIIMLITGFTLEIIKKTLSHFFPKQKWIQRPEGTNYKGLIPGMWNNMGGMPSGHEALTSFAFTILYFTYPGVWSLLALIVASVIMFLARYIGLYHKPLQLIVGWIIGFVVALIAHKYIFKNLKSNKNSFNIK